MAFLSLLLAPPAHAATSGISVDHSQGVVLVGDGLLPCHASANGGLRYHSVATISMQSCNGAAWADIGVASVALSSITAAASGPTINNAANAQTWQWSTLGGGNGLSLTTSSTAAAANTQTLLNISLTGANGTSTQTTYGEKISNTHTGTSSTNVGLYATASGAVNNYAGLFTGLVGIGTATPLSGLHVVGTSDATIYDDAYGTGNYPYLLQRGAFGTSGSPTAEQNADELFYLGGQGYGATAWPIFNVGKIGMYPTENFTDTAQGTYMDVEVTPNGTIPSSARAVIMKVQNTTEIGYDHDGLSYLDAQNMAASNGAGARFVTTEDSGYFRMGRSALETTGTTGGGNAYLWMGGDAVGANGDMLIATNDNERMRITKAGLIGVNQTSPAAQLDINDASSGANSALRVQQADGGPWAIMINNATFGTTDATGFAMEQQTDGTATFYNNNTTIMNISPADDITIGGWRGGSNTITFFGGSNSTLQNVPLGLRNNNIDTHGNINIDIDTDNSGGTSDWFGVNQGAGPTARFKVFANGDVDLATTGTYINWGATTGTTGYGFRDSAGTLQRKNSGGSWQTINTSSDRRLKRDITDLPDDDGLAAIMKLRPVRFRWKDVENDKTQGPQIGLIAQEVEKVLPDSGITYNNGDAVLTLPGGSKETVRGARGMNYEKLAVPLIKAMQQQGTEIDDLKTANHELRREVTALKKRMAENNLKK